jgi:uncharacterized membrane protein
MFNFYWPLLVISGFAMLAIAVLNVGELSTGERVLNAFLGVGFLGYGLYLVAFNHGEGTYFIFFKAFIVPVVLVVRAVRAQIDKSNRRKAAQNLVGGQMPIQPASPYDVNPNR